VGSKRGQRFAAGRALAIVKEKEYEVSPALVVPEVDPPATAIWQLEEGDNLPGHQLGLERLTLSLKSIMIGHRSNFFLLPNPWVTTLAISVPAAVHSSTGRANGAGTPLAGKRGKLLR
jgi:hypothetical protein